MLLFFFRNHGRSRRKSKRLGFSVRFDRMGSPFRIKISQ